MDHPNQNPNTTMAQTCSILPHLVLLLFLPNPIPLSSATSPTRPPRTTSSPASGTEHTPAPWPLQFHALLFMNYSGALSMIDLWYDWSNGRNVNIIQDQLDGPPLYDLEWNNGTSFFYTLSSPLSCSSSQLDVGILRPNWLAGATNLGQEYVDGFLCNVWTKVDFIWYYEDVATKRPVHWVFYTGRAAHVMTFEVGAVLEDAKWQAPVYCFNEEEKASAESHSISNVFQQRLKEKRSLRALMEF